MVKPVGLPYTLGSATSKAAAKSMVKPAVNLRAKIWRFIRNCGRDGATSDEVNVHFGIPNSSTTRVTELMRLGRITRTDRTRPTRSGCQAKIHIAVRPSDWIDKREGWPTPTEEQCESELTKTRKSRDKWKARAYRFRKLYEEKC